MWNEIGGNKIVDKKNVNVEIKKETEQKKQNNQR
jgi:hypothetical protein